MSRSVYVFSDTAGWITSALRPSPPSDSATCLGPTLSGGMQCHTFRQRLTEVRMWVTVTADGYAAWNRLADTSSEEENAELVA